MQTELEGGEGEVEDEVEGKREGDYPRNLPCERLIKNRAEGNGDNRIENCPNGSKNPSRRRPRGLHERRVPAIGVHTQIIPRESKRPGYDEKAEEDEKKYQICGSFYAFFRLG